MDTSKLIKRLKAPPDGGEIREDLGREAQILLTAMLVLRPKPPCPPDRLPRPTDGVPRIP